MMLDNTFWHLIYMMMFDYTWESMINLNDAWLSLVMLDSIMMMLFNAWYSSDYTWQNMMLDYRWWCLAILYHTFWSLKCMMICWCLIKLDKALWCLTIFYHALCMMMLNYPWWLIIWNLPGLCACGHTCGQHWRAPSQWSRAPRRCHQTISPPRPTYPQVTQTWAPAWLLFSGRPDIRNWSNIFGHHFQNIVWKMLAWTNYSLVQIIVLGPLNKN